MTRKQKHPGVQLLVYLFQPQRAELIRLARPYRRLESKATKKNHHHPHRPAGSKLMKRFDRARWNQKYFPVND